MSTRPVSDMEMMLATSYNGGSVKEGNTDDFNSNLPAAYTTVDTARKEHAKYHSHQVKNPEAPATGTTDQISEYDVAVPADPGVKMGTVGCGSEESGGGGGGLVREVVQNPPESLRPRLEAKNVLYEDSELHPDRMKHRGVHAGSYDTYSRSHSGYQEMSESWGSYVTCRCKTRTLVITFFIAMAILLSVASLVLSSLLWFGVYGANSSSSSSSSHTPTTGAPTSTPSASMCSCQAETEELRAQVNSIRDRFQAIKNDTTTAQLSQRLSLLKTELTTLDGLAGELAARRERKITTTNVEVLDECESRPVDFCTIQDVPAGDTQNPCLTDGVDVEKEGEFLVNAVCAVSGDVIPANETVVATLETISHQGRLRMRCRCSRLLGHPSETHIPGGIHDCVLRETRCPMTTNINVTLDWET